MGCGNLGAPRPNRLQYFDPVAPGKHPIEHDQIKAFAAQKEEAFFSRVRQHHREPFALQAGFQRLGRLVIVLYDQ